MYIEYSVTKNVADVETPRFYTSMTANKQFSGESNRVLNDLNLLDGKEYLFMPTVEGSVLNGEIGMESRTYTGGTVSQTYGFSSVE